MSPKELQENIDWLRQMQVGGTPDYPEFGICSNLPYMIYVGKYAAGWPEYSGDPEYPVPAPYGVPPVKAYYGHYPENKWEGEYGAARRRMCGYLADRLEEELHAA